MIQFFSEEARRNPFPMYKLAQEGVPVVHEPVSKAWMLFDYDSVKRAISDHDAFSSSMFHAGRANPSWLIFFDPPQHTRLRALIASAFTPRMVANLEPRIRQLTRELLDARVEAGEMDAAIDFAIPLPMMVISEMIGVPSADWPRFRQWSEVILRLSYTITDGVEATAASAGYFATTAEMTTYLSALFEERRQSTKDDLLTRMVQAEVEGDRLTEKDLVAFVQLLLVAGNETTTNLINNALLCFLEHPDQMARLRENPELLTSSIEETLRYRSPVQWLFRAALRDVEMHGQTIPKGSLVLPIIGSANRDGRVFADADRFMIGREPNPHIAFGHGIHFCLGAALSRLEARIALGYFFDRVRSLEYAGSWPWEPRKALHVHGPARLPIRVTTDGRLSARSAS